MAGSVPLWQVLRRSISGNLLTFPILLAKNLELRRDARKMLAAVEGPRGLTPAPS